MDPKDNQVLLHLYLEVFRNNLIISKIESFMSFHDLKSLRLVDRALNQAVLEEGNFAEKSRVVLKKPELTHPAILTFSWKPKHFKIYPFVEKQGTGGAAITSAVTNLISDCKSLLVYEDEDPTMMTEERAMAHFQFAGKHSSFPRMPTVLRNAKKLTYLEVDSSAFYHLLEGNNKRDHPNIRTKTLKIRFVGTYGKARTFPRILEDARGLERIQIDVYGLRICESMGLRVAYEIPRGFWPSYSNLIANNQESIRHLNMLPSQFWQAYAAGHREELQLSKLNSLTINLDETASKSVADQVFTFLDAHIPQLEHLNLNSADDRFFLLLKKASSKLKRLAVQAPEPKGQLLVEGLRKLKGTTFTDLSFGPFQTDKWATRFVEPKGRAPRIDIIAEFFPVTLEKIELVGPIRDYYFRLNSESLKDFLHVTWLELLDVFEMDNACVTYICQNLVQLKHLTVQRSRSAYEKREILITDEAFLASTPDNEEGVDGAPETQTMIPALANLKKLEFLRLWYLEITMKTVLEGVKFRNLRALQVELLFTSADAEEILKNNPSLKIITCFRFEGSYTRLEQVSTLSFPHYAYGRGAQEFRVVNA